MLEVEVKVKTEIAGAEEKLKELGYCVGTKVYERDTYYNGKCMDLKAADKALRIREHRDLSSGQVRYVLNFKGPRVDDATMTRAETQFDVPSLKAGETVLNGLGFYPAGNVEKTRLHYRREDMTCCLDNVTGLGEFLEIEIMAEEENYDEAVGRIEKLLKKLGLCLSDTIRESYLTMLEKKKN